MYMHFLWLVISILRLIFKDVAPFILDRAESEMQFGTELQMLQLYKMYILQMYKN